MNNLSQVHQNSEIERLRAELAEANDTLEAIRTGQIDALVVNGHNGHSLYTLSSADRAYRLFIEQMTEGAVTLNNEGLILYSNSQFATLVQRPLSSVMGSYFLDFIFEEDIDIFSGLLSAGWKGNVRSQVRLRAGGSHVDVQLSVNVLQLDDEVSLSVIVTDLTQYKAIERALTAKNDELRKVNDALVASNHDLQQFASVASHDLQEPLRKIQIFSRFLKDTGFNELSQTSKNYIDKIINASQRMKVLIVDILSYSRLSADDIHADAVDLDKVLDEILEDFDLRIAEKNAIITVSNLCVVEGNRGQLRQVFHNLINNALKFVSSGRSPVIYVRQKEIDPVELGFPLDPARYCCITISDNGIGFEESYAASIFSLFEKLNAKSAYEGSGIGLAIAKKIVDKHHGLIWAKSRVGIGSEFSVILPLKQPINQ